MQLATAQNIVDYVLLNSPIEEKIEFGFFGGEPLLEFGLIRDIVQVIQCHQLYSPERVTFTVTTNGTIITDSIIDFLKANNIVLCISCDGPPSIQDKHRRFRDGKGSSTLVEGNIARALNTFPYIPVNAVYSPSTLESIPDVVGYLALLGVERIFLNPDISATWTKKDADKLPDLFGKIGKLYVDYHLQGKPKYISLIDSKISVILRGGYQPLEKCRMGSGELAFAPSGNIYPCERLIGADDGNLHCLGNINIDNGIPQNCRCIPTKAINTECMQCSLNAYCMNWCGCTNYAMSGAYNMVAPFLCASEKAAISVAFDTIKVASKSHLDLSHNQIGSSLVDGACTVKENTTGVVVNK
jgi:uncharacterized protein